MRILLVEDEDALAQDLARALAAAGYVPEIAADGETAWFLGDTEDFSAVILDLGLPQLDGLSILKRWRASGVETPVLILTARDGWSERVDGIDAGADDYIPKPFQMEELLARLRAVLRRAAGRANPVIAIGRTVVDPRQMRISVDGAPVALSALEYRAVAYLAHHRGRVVPIHELAEHVYGVDDKGANTVEVLIGRARKKLGVELIETRRGFGYIIPAEGSDGEAESSGSASGEGGAAGFGPGRDG